jgi:pimeloyl-ACP methyl ester carboxylesterase
MAQDIHALIKSLGYDSIRLVAHDIGLMVAYAYAAQHPDEVDRLVLMEAFLPGVGDWNSVFCCATSATARCRLRWSPAASGPIWSTSGTSLPPIRTNRSRKKDRELYAKAYAQPGHMAAGMKVFSRLSEGCLGFARLSKVKLKMPLLVLSGEKAGRPFLIEQGKMVASNVEGVLVKGAGHWLMEEAPDQVMAKLVEFLNR